MQLQSMANAGRRLTISIVIRRLENWRSYADCNEFAGQFICDGKKTVCRNVVYDMLLSPSN